jgi:GNAT superfamily N-acetyltransferase
MASLIAPRPLGQDDDRSTFDCGRDSLNQWFQRHAWHNQEGNVSRTNVVCDPVTGVIVGYVSLSTAQVERAHLPKSSQRNRPDPIPAVLLGQLAVDRRYQGRGYARSLLLFALTTAVRVSRDIGCFGVITHPLDDEVRAFYCRFGFEALPFDPARSMAVRIVDLERAGISAPQVP